MKKSILLLALLFTINFNAQNIQLLLSTTVDIEQVKDSIDINGNSLFNFQCARVTEMIDGWLILVNEPDDFDLIETTIENLGDVVIVGTYYMDGSQYLWGNTISRNHSIQKYTANLKNKRTYDVNGNILTDVPYTELEALNRQVNRYAGTPIRILN